eukprot:Clim_evm50s232 gene=Clim_evmTU50s232
MRPSEDEGPVVEDTAAGSGVAAVARSTFASLFKGSGKTFWSLFTRSYANPLRIMRPVKFGTSDLVGRHYKRRHQTAHAALGAQSFFKEYATMVALNSMAGLALFQTYTQLFTTLKPHLVDRRMPQAAPVAAWISGCTAGMIQAPISIIGENFRLYCLAHPLSDESLASYLKASLNRTTAHRPFRGLEHVVFRDAFGFGAFFSGYRFARAEFTRLDEEQMWGVPRTMIVATAGGWAGICYALWSHTLFRAETLMFPDQYTSIHRHRSHHEVLVPGHVIKTIGRTVAYLCKGLPLALVRAATPAAVGFTVYEFFLPDLLNEDEAEEKPRK